VELNITRKQIAKNFSWLLAGNAASGLLNFFAIIYIARVLGATAFGLVQFAQAFLLYLVIIVDAGLSTYGTREIAREPGQAGQVSSNILLLRLLIAFLTFALSLLVCLFLPIPGTLRLLFIITFLLVFYRAFSIDWVFQGLEKMEYVAASKFLFAAASFGLIVALVKRPEHLLAVPLIQLFVGFVLAVFMVFVLFKFFVVFDRKLVAPRNWLNIFWLAIPLGLSTLLMQIYDNLDTIMLGFMDKPATVGIYSAAYRIFYIFAGVLSLWLATLLPVVCRKISDNKADAGLFQKKIFRLTLLCVVPVTILAYFIAPFLIGLFFGQGYGEASLALRWLIWALIPLAINGIYGGLVLIPAGRFNHFLAAAGAGALINVVMNFILIPCFSFVGAAIATVVAQGVAALIAFYFSREYFALTEKA